jgi:hypothetical protein
MLVIKNPGHQSKQKGADISANPLLCMVAMRGLEPRTSAL